MTLTLILVTTVAAGGLVFSLCRQLARLDRRVVIALTVAAGGLYGAFLYVRPENWLLVDLVVLGVAGTAGSGLGLLIGSRVSLITFSIAASAVDIYSVMRGATAGLVDSYRDGSSDLLRYLAVSVPTDEGVRPVVGVGDFVILTAICFALTRLQYHPFGTLLAPLSGLLLAIVVGTLVGGIFAIPFIAATTILFVTLGEAPRAE